MELICNCKTVINKVDVWFLKDIKNFEARKLIIGLCSKCHRPVVTLIEKRISDGQIFQDENITGNNAVKIINRESKRALCRYFKVDTYSLCGWVFGINTEIKNKKGDVTQVRQYSSDFYGKKKIVKKQIVKK
jgi:hypothetical protein